MDYQNLILPTRGRTCKAIYRTQEIPSYVENPMIEALPGILTTKEAMERLAFYPTYEESMRNLPDEQRYHLLEDIVRFFTPLSIHVDLERRISRVIRAGYIERNPTKTKFWKENGTRSTEVIKNASDQYSNYQDDFHSTSAFGFNIVGISGIGKSLAVERILRLYPQVIQHTAYKGRKFTFSQIVWLKLDCPFDGGIKGLCINFFQTVDSLLGTSYHKNYANRSRNTDEMLPYMALVAANHGIGVLVIDEIQRLSLAKSGGIEKMLNFFDQLVNTAGVPVIQVGTYKSISIFESNFSQMRRGTGQGDLIWSKMECNNEWELFVKALWYFQYTKKICFIDKNLKLIDVLYEETQGVTDLAVKAYMLAQERAIETGKEIINASVIRSVCRDKFRMLRLALDALKSKTKNALVRFEDAYPQFLEQYLKELIEYSKSKSNIPPIQIEGELASDPEIRLLFDKQRKSEKSNNSEPNNSKTDSTDQNLDSFDSIETKVISKNSAETLPTEFIFPVLPQVLASLDRINNEDIYEALNEAGFIRSGSEFLREGGI